MNKATTFRGNKRLYSYLRCKLYTTTGNKDLCTSHSIRLDLLREEVTKRLKQHIDNYLNESDIAQKIEDENNFNENVRALQNDLVSIEKQINQSSYVLKNLYMDKVNQVITDEQFTELNTSFLREKETYLKRKEELEKRIYNLNEDSRNIDKWIGIVKRYKDFAELNHIIVNEFIDYIEIGEKDKDTREQKIKIHWLF